MKLTKQLSQYPLVKPLAIALMAGALTISVFDYVGDATERIAKQQTQIQQMDKDIQMLSNTLHAVEAQNKQYTQTITEQQKTITEQQKIVDEQKSQLQRDKVQTSSISRGSSPLEGKQLTFTATAYTAGPHGISFSGKRTHVGTISVDPRIVPLGTHMYIEGYGYGIAEDTGSAIKGYKLDLFMASTKNCVDWGKRQVKVTILD